MKTVLILALALACIVVGILADNTSVSLEKVDYYSDDLPSQFYGYRIMCIADYHNAFYFDQIAGLIDEEKPDAVLFLGDMTELNDSNWDNLLRLLKSIDGEIPVYGVQGNHESMRHNASGLSAELKKYGMKMLDNNKVTLYRDDASIDLIGVNDVATNEDEIADSWMLEQMRIYLDNVVEEERFTLLACHRANLYPYLSDLPADLMLSGHIHGGVVRLPKAGGMFHVDGSLFPDYDKGFYSEGEMEMYVSSGCDFDIGKFRVLNGPSLTLLTLKR